MDIPINAKVQCTDGSCGKSAYIVINSTNDQVTHVVVELGASPLSQRIVPVDKIDGSTHDVIHLQCTRDQVAAMEHFTETEFVPGFAPYSGYAPGQYWLTPNLAPGAFFLKEERDRIPEGSLAVQRGAPVCATDGQVGRVDEFIVDPSNRQITHLVLGQGHLWGHRDVSIPVSQIDRIEDESVHVKLSKHEIEALPHVPVQRHPAEAPKEPDSK